VFIERKLQKILPLRRAEPRLSRIFSSSKTLAPLDAGGVIGGPINIGLLGASVLFGCAFIHHGDAEVSEKKN